MPIRTYGLQDVLRALNGDSTAYLSPDPNEIISQFLPGAETLKVQPGWTETLYTPYPFLVADQDGPTGFWLLGDPAASTTVFDSNPYGPKTMGTPSAAGVTFGGSGPLSGLNAAAFDGATGTWIQIPSATNTNFTRGHDFSVEFWFKFTGAGLADRSFMEKWTAAASYPYSFRGLATSATDLRFLRYDGTSNPSISQTSSPITLNDGAWHHIVGTLQGTTMSLYVDGSLRGSGTDTTTTETGNSDPLTIANRGAGGHGMPCQMAGVAIYPIALSAQQVANHRAWGTAANAQGIYGFGANIIPGAEFPSLAFWDPTTLAEWQLASDSPRASRGSALCTRTALGPSSWNQLRSRVPPDSTVGTSPDLFPVTPGQVYYLSIWSKQSAGTQSSHFKLTWFDASGAGISFTAPMSGQSGIRPWTHYSGTWTVPVGAAYAQIACMAGWWDGVNGQNAQTWYAEPFVGLMPANDAVRYGEFRYPNPPKRGSNLWGSAAWGSFNWG